MTPAARLELLVMRFRVDLAVKWRTCHTVQTIPSLTPCTSLSLSPSLTQNPLFVVNMSLAHFTASVQHSAVFIATHVTANNRALVEYLIHN